MSSTLLVLVAIALVLAGQLVINLQMRDRLDRLVEQKDKQ